MAHLFGPIGHFIVFLLFDPLEACPPQVGGRQGVSLLLKHPPKSSLEGGLDRIGILCFLRPKLDLGRH